MSNEDAHRKVFQRSIVSLRDKYTNEERGILNEFMHSDFPKWEIGGGRHAKLAIEYPHSSICTPEEWQDSMNRIVAPEWETLHPDLKQRNMIVRFVPKLTDFREGGVEIGGHGHVVKAGKNTEYWYRIPILDGNNDLLNEKQILFVLMHELAETDFWRKTTPSEWISLLNEDKLALDYLKSDRHKEYAELTDESLANRRAWRALRRKWPNIQDEGVIGYPIADVDLA